VRRQRKCLKKVFVSLLHGQPLFWNKAWKYTHPIEDEEAKKLKQRLEAAEYERVVRFNYDKDERSTLVDAISMIKGLENVMLQQNAAAYMMTIWHFYKSCQIITLERIFTKLLSCKQLLPLSLIHKFNRTFMLQNCQRISLIKLQEL